MSFRLEMLQVSRLAPVLLGESADLVARFIGSQWNAEGGFRDRTGASDLYYTVFGLDALIALQRSADTDRTRTYLESYRDGASLDFVHLCALARCWAALGTRPSFSRQMIRRIEAFRARDGGFNPQAQSAHGTAYGAYLALGACQDLGVELTRPMDLVRSLKFLETADGAWTNEALPAAAMRIGSTNATAAVVTVLRHLDMPIHAAVGDWLLARCHTQGGFLAIPNAPIPDLLSTATALHALSGMQISFRHLRESCLDFVDSLWTNEGSFHGNWTDDHLDCEYTFYGLLALGHLSHET